MKILLIFVVLILFSSCGKKNDKTASSKAEISFWHFWSEPNQMKVLTSIVDDFEKNNNCKVNMTQLSWNDGKTKLFAAFNSETGPDVLELGSDWVAQFSSAGVLAELKSDDDKINMSKFIDFSTSPSYWNEKIYALPWIIDTRVIYFNKTLLNKAGISNPPKTMKDLLDYSKKINDIEDVYGFGTNGADKNRLYKKIITFLWSNGGGLIDEKKSILNSKENETAFEMIKELSKYSIIETQRNLDDLFAKGKIGFTISGSWLTAKINEFNAGFEYGVMIIPSFNGHKGVSFAGGEYLSINNNSQNIELSKKFLAYMTNGKNSIKFCKQVPEAGFPADKNYYKNTELIANPIKAEFAEQLENSKMTPLHPNWLDIQDELERLAEKIIYDKVDIKTGLEESSNKLTNILQK